MKVVYTDQPGNERGVCYRTKFLGVISGATAVEIEGDFPGVAEAYERAGIAVSGSKQGAGKQDGDETDPHKMKVADLKEWLTEQGIEFDPSAKKEELQGLIPQQDGGETEPKTED